LHGVEFINTSTMNDREGSIPMQTDPTPYIDMNALIEQLLSRIQEVLGKKLVGLYLYGSLVTGDFDHGSSDIDLLAAILSDIDEEEFAALQKMHDDFVHKNKQWNGRIEVAYLSVAGLKTYRSQLSKIAIISPGEPFHIKEAGNDWLINWYTVREKGIVLYGSSPKMLIDPISKDEYLHAVQRFIKAWCERIQQIHLRPSQAYAILTMCRALYTLKNGEMVSKKQAALWAEKELPEWFSLIQQALFWREAWRNEHVDHDATLPETLRFVHFVISLCDNIPDVSRPDSDHHPII